MGNELSVKGCTVCTVHPFIGSTWKILSEGTISACQIGSPARLLQEADMCLAMRS